MGYPMMFGLSIVGFDGAAVSLTDYGRSLTRRTMLYNDEAQLMPRKAFKMQYPLSRAFDLTKPGKYLVTARFCTPQLSGTNLVYVISNTVTVEVTAASSEEPKSK
jgi:hypothetical protein